MNLRRPSWLLAGLITACASGAGSTTSAIQPITTVTSTDHQTTAATLLSYLLATESVGGLPVEIFGPGQLSTLPVVVMFHGGGWYGGSPVSMTGLAEHLASEGFVVFNATYRTSSGGFPDSFDDVSCALRYAQARAHEFSSAEKTISVVAHSAGAHLAAVVTLAGDIFGNQCQESESVAIDRFVGIAGPYDPTLYAMLLAQYFGTRLEDDPAPWESGNPYTYLGTSTQTEFLLAHGDSDELVPIESSELFYEALVDAGYQARFEVLPNASHLDSDDATVVGDLVVEFLDANPG